MSKLKYVNVELTGTSPLLMDRLTSLGGISPTGGKKAKAINVCPTDDEFWDFVNNMAYSDEDGRLYFPLKWIQAAIDEAGRLVKVGKRQISTQKSSMLRSCVFVDGPRGELFSDGLPVFVKPNNGIIVTEDDLVVGYPKWIDKSEAEKLFVVYAHRFANNGTAGRINKWCPAIYPWAAVFQIRIDLDVLQEDVIKECFDGAGSRFGVGNWRREHKGDFGAFFVSSWKTIKEV